MKTELSIRSATRLATLGVVLASPLALVALPASAAPVLDGMRDAVYGLRSVQTVQTQFGDANPNGGSELDAAYAHVEGGTLYLMLTGNLESNFNRLNLFIDSVAGGQNVLENSTDSGGSNPTNDGWAAKHAGFTFDAGFFADYMLSLRSGVFGTARFDADFSVIGGGANAFEAATAIFGNALTGASASALPGAGIGIAFDNSNTGGVTGGTGAANAAAAAAVATGIELAIPLSAIGSPDPEDIRISAMINGSNHDYLSNQFLGGLMPPQGNLGGDGAGAFNGTIGQINLQNASYAAGNQFFTVAERTAVPEPATIALAGLALAGMAGMRRRRS